MNENAVQQEIEVSGRHAIAQIILGTLIYLFPAQTQIRQRLMRKRHLLKKYKAGMWFGRAHKFVSKREKYWAGKAFLKGGKKRRHFSFFLDEPIYLQIPNLSNTPGTIHLLTPNYPQKQPSIVDKVFEKQRRGKLVGCRRPNKNSKRQPRGTHQWLPKGCLLIPQIDRWGSAMSVSAWTFGIDQIGRRLPIAGFAPGLLH